jgi:hypothetical protein
VPTRPAADFSNIAKIFNDNRDIGIVFNAYNLKTGVCTENLGSGVVVVKSAKNGV